MSSIFDDYSASRRAMADAMTDEGALEILSGAVVPPPGERIHQSLAKLTAASLRSMDALQEKVERAGRGKSICPLEAAQRRMDEEEL